VANPVPDPGARRGPPGKLDDGSREDKRRDRRTQLTVALIGAVAVIAAAVIGLIHPWSSGGLQLGINSVSHPVVDGTRIIEVTGTVANLGAGEFVYAFAGRQADIPPWYPGGPAAISGSGQWSTSRSGLGWRLRCSLRGAPHGHALPLRNESCSFRNLRPKALTRHS
jgi:hypothetical protein